jgi:tetratricopeptide (TPR) repeat protein
MAMGSQQLADDYGQIKDTLELYPNISVVKTEGQPPDNYEIEYRQRGYTKTSDGSVTIAQSHRIRISLPFGYPHFAPIAKPLTPVFHPDFDPAAIRIADHWQQNPSLPDLVLHIGEMINGSAYNIEEPFNQEAADWYQAHQSQLPLDSLSIADIEEPNADLDSLVDDTFASLGLENDDFLEPEKPVGPEDIAYIHDLIAENKIFSAQKLLADFPKTADFPDREELHQKIGKILRKTDQLFKLAEQLEDMGKLDEALEVAENILALAVDTPGAEPLRSRIQQSFLLAQPAGGGTKKKEKEIENKSNTTVKPSRHSSPSKLPVQWKFPKIGLSYKPLVVLILILGIGIGAISLYFKDQNALSQSQAHLLKGQLLIDKKEFDSSLEALEFAQKALANLTILRYRKQPLDQEIEKLLTSSDLQEGLKGRILYQGQYISSTKATRLNELAVLTSQAQDLAGQNKVEEALTIYRQALKHATEHNLEKQLDSIKENIQSLELRHTLSLAEKAEQEKNWNKAAEAYRKALQLSGKIKNLGTASDITHRLTAATFRHELDQSKKAFVQSQWQETIKFLEHAQQVITANPNVVTGREQQDLRQLLVNSRLYLMLSTAREAYEQRNWDLAIENYQNALALLADESLSTENTLGESLSKIETTLLMVKIAKIQDKVLVAEENGDKEAILVHSRETLQMIHDSKFAQDPALKKVALKINEKVKKVQEQLILDKKIAWLEEHYDEIFRANYPTFQGSKLVKPKAVFLRNIGKNPVFTITCFELSLGSSSKLELNYMFNSNTEKWTVYNGQ